MNKNISLIIKRKNVKYNLSSSKSILNFYLNNNNLDNINKFNKFNKLCIFNIINKLSLYIISKIKFILLFFILFLYIVKYT